MKILMVNTEHSRGGAAQTACRLNAAVNARGVSSVIAYGRGRKATDANSYRFGVLPEVYIHAFLARAAGIHGYGSRISTMRLENYIRRNGFDVMHLHNLHGYYIDLSFIRRLKEINKPVVWTLHDGWPVTGRCPYLSDCERWKVGCGECPDLGAYPRSWFLDTSSLMHRIKRKLFCNGWRPLLVTPSKWLAKSIKESCLGGLRIEIIPNGVDTGAFRPMDKNAARTRLGIPAKRRVVLLMAANLKDRRKGAGHFFDALKYINNDGLTVLIAGGGVEIDDAQAGKYDIRQTGFVSGAGALADLYNAADVFCVTYLNDNFPNTVLESMSCGTPVVGFDSGGVSEQVTEGCGILVPPRDSVMLGGAIDRLLGDDAMRAAYGAAARNKAITEYGMDKFAGRYISLYNELMQNHREQA